MIDEIYDLFRRNFPFAYRAEGTARRILADGDNHIFEKRNADGALTGCAVVRADTVLLLAVDEAYRNRGAGSELLAKCERLIADGGYGRVAVGAGAEYLTPGVPTGRRYAESVHERLDPAVNDRASSFFEKRGYRHSWGGCNCFDMKMDLRTAGGLRWTVGAEVGGVRYRWAAAGDLPDVVACADDACRYQDDKFSKYYKDPSLYDPAGRERVLAAVKEDRVVGALIVSAETEAEDTGSVGCTCVSAKETHRGIGTELVRIGTRHLKDLGLSTATLGYTYSGLDRLYGAAGYEISVYYMMAEKKLCRSDG